MGAAADHPRGSTGEPLAGRAKEIDAHESAGACVSRVFVSGIVTALVGTALAVLHPRLAHAQGAPPESDVAQRLNPFADAILIPATFGAGINGESSGITAISVELEPRIPFPLHRNWRLVSLWD